MKKEKIISLLAQNHEAFVEKLRSLSEQDFLRCPGNKWSAGQQLDHVLKSVVPIAKAYNVPLNVLEHKYGFAGRTSRTYKGVVQTYQHMLKRQAGYTVPERFTPSQIPLENKDEMLDKLLKSIQDLNEGISRMEESELDSHQLAHPLMGKLTLREMLYFTAYHVIHHDKQILHNLNAHKE